LPVAIHNELKPEAILKSRTSRSIFRGI